MKFNIVTGNNVIDTGKVSFKFIFDSKMNFDDHRKVDNWGTIHKQTDNTYLVNVFNSKKGGLIYGWGNDKIEDENWMKELLEGIPESTLLMEKDTAEIFKKYCDKFDYEYTYTYFDGDLVTC